MDEQSPARGCIARLQKLLDRTQLVDRAYDERVSHLRISIQREAEEAICWMIRRPLRVHFRAGMIDRVWVQVGNSNYIQDIEKWVEEGATKIYERLFDAGSATADRLSEDLYRAVMALVTSGFFTYRKVAEFEPRVGVTADGQSKSAA